MSDQLTAFLAGDEAPAPEKPPAPDKPDKPETPTPAPQEKPTAPAAPEAEDDGEIPEPREGEPVVPRKALEDERHKRQDWKARAIQHETEAASLRQQLEEAKKPPPAPVEAPRPLSQEEQRMQGFMLNQHLNTSEMLTRREVGADVVDAAVLDFKAAAQADPSLFQTLYSQPDPYGWLVREVERLKLQKEIGGDPVAWRVAERERMRKELEAEAAGTPPRSPVAGLPPSLANVRSALPRSSTAFTGPLSLDDILAQRKR